MTKLTIMVAALFLSQSIATTYAHSPQMTQEEIISQMSVVELVAHFADEYNVSETQMLGTIRCESSLKTNAVGDGGRSFGLSQIFLPAHPHITKEQALDKVFAVEFMAKEFSKGHQSKWTCWRNIYKK